MCYFDRNTVDRFFSETLSIVQVCTRPLWHRFARIRYPPTKTPIWLTGTVGTVNFDDIEPNFYSFKDKKK